MRNPSLVRLIRLARLAAALVVLAAVPGSARAATFVVNIGGNGIPAFVDQASGTGTTTIHVGDTVQWMWLSGPHSTSAGTCTSGGGYYGGSCTTDGQWESGQQSAGASFSHTFNTAGNFNYFCSVHQAMMQGMVKVQAVTTAPPAAAFRFSPTGPVVGTTVRFVDTSTGGPASWAWDFGDGQVASVQNPSHSFAAPGAYTVTLTATNSGGSNATSQSVTVTAGGQTSCVADAATLCLSNNRFQVTARWQKPDGSSGNGNAIPLTGDSGYFWFFDPSNIELITKVLNACGVNGDYWVFGAGLTNVKVTVDVLDTSNGVSEQYVNTLGTAFAPIQDTAAFPTCP